jgi:membrane-bound acyltransferase YfiQ involved in biofilm formation
VIAILILLAFHTGMIFVSWGWHIKSQDTSKAFEAVMAWLHHWRMPLLLFISGAGTFFALGFRTPGKYLGERFKRLFIPLLFGMLVVVPPQVYFERIGKYGSYWDFYKTVFELVPYPAGSLTWHHLWFILYLFLFSALALPIFLWLRSGRADRFFDGLLGYLRRPGGFALLLLPVLLTQLALGPSFPGETHSLVDDWAYFALCFLFFLNGYLCCRDRRVWALLEEKRREHLITAVALLVPFYLTYYVTYTASFFGYDAIYRIPSFLVGWYWVLALIGYGQRYLNVDKPILKYANEAVYPFYILHQTVIIFIGYHVIRWHRGVYLNYLLVLLLSFLATAAIYALLIRPFNATRFLFGMKPKQRAARRQAGWAILGTPLSAEGVLKQEAVR